MNNERASPPGVESAKPDERGLGAVPMATTAFADGAEWQRQRHDTAEPHEAFRAALKKERVRRFGPLGEVPVAGHPAAAPGSVEFATDALDAGENDGGEGARAVRRPAAATAEPIRVGPPQPDGITTSPAILAAIQRETALMPTSPSVLGDGFDVLRVLVADVKNGHSRSRWTGTMTVALDALLREHGQIRRESGEQHRLIIALRTALEAAEADTRRLDWLFADLTSLVISAKINRIADSYVAIHVRTPETTLTFRSAIDAASQGASGPEEGKA